MQDWSDSPTPPPPASPHNPYAPPSAPGGPPVVGGGDRLPWLDRSQLGWGAALIETVKLIVQDARGAFARVRPDGDYVSPFLFGLFIAWVMTIIGQIWSFAFSGLWTGMLGGLEGMEGMGAMGAVGFAQVVMVAFLFPIIYPIIILISSGIYHLGLMVLGGLNDSESRFEGTFNVMSYSQVATLANIVPIVGGLVAFGLQVYFNYHGFMQVHRTSSGKALAAALLPIILCCVCVIAMIMAAGGAAFMGAASQ
ncbi:MAG: YIP1 family protein [Acidobacteriota bacterium]